MSPIPDSPTRTTPRGTPCASSWTEDWIAAVEAREQAMDRRICGARTIGGKPCPQAADHPSGRCRHHGGFALTGAPAGNRNAVIHGLYSRRLAIVGSHNPGWQSDPTGGGAPDQGRGVVQLANADRAICPFELAEYNALVTDLMQRTCAGGNNPMGLHLAHQVALLTVMVGRATRALAQSSLTQKMEQSAEDYYMAVEKPSAALMAFEKLSAELRRWMQHIEKHYPLSAEVSAETQLECDLRRASDTRTDPDGLADLNAAHTIADERYAEQRANDRASADARKALARAEAENATHWDLKHFHQRTGTAPTPLSTTDLLTKLLNHTAHPPG